LNLQYDDTLSNYAFDFNLRRYSKNEELTSRVAALEEELQVYTDSDSAKSLTIKQQLEAGAPTPGAYTRPLFSST